MTDPDRFTRVAVVVQAVLGAAGWYGATAIGAPVRFGPRPLASLAIGVGVGATLGALVRALFARQPSWLASLRRTVDEQLVPTVGRLGTGQIVVVSLAAGVGEELCFRGWLQPLVGALPASLVFGAAHVAGVRTLPLGAWATVMGGALGALVAPTGGLGASMTAHACYDLIAFQYLRTRALASADGRDGW